MFDTVFGLPLHPLVVHATVVVVPSAAVAVALAAIWPRFRAWAGFLPMGLAAAAVVLVPVSTSSGEYLQGKVVDTELVREHTAMAEGLAPWVVLLAVAAAGLLFVWMTERHPSPSSADVPNRSQRGERGGGRDAVARLLTTQLPRYVVLSLAVVALVASLGTTVQVVRIGHSGARASWSHAG